MATVDVTATLHLKELVIELSQNLSYDGLVDFVMDLDEVVADTAFAEQLTKRLVKVLKDEYGDDFHPSLVGL